MSVADEAEQAVHGGRQDAYGGPQESFDLIAQMWSAYTNTFLTAQDVAMMMVLFKTARARKGILLKLEPQHDSLVDIIGYVLCSDLIRTGASTSDSEPAPANERKNLHHYY